MLAPELKSLSIVGVKYLYMENLKFFIRFLFDYSVIIKDLDSKRFDWPKNYYESCIILYKLNFLKKLFLINGYLHLGEIVKITSKNISYNDSI
jgi:hypothetical protein